MVNSHGADESPTGNTSSNRTPPFPLEAEEGGGRFLHFHIVVGGGTVRSAAELAALERLATHAWQGRQSPVQPDLRLRSPGFTWQLGNLKSE